MSYNQQYVLGAQMQQAHLQAQAQAHAQAQAQAEAQAAAAAQQAAVQQAAAAASAAAAVQSNPVMQSAHLELGGPPTPATMAIRRPFDPTAHDLDANFRLTRFADLKG